MCGRLYVTDGRGFGPLPLALRLCTDKNLVIPYVSRYESIHCNTVSKATYCFIGLCSFCLAVCARLSYVGVEESKGKRWITNDHHVNREPHGSIDVLSYEELLK